MSTTPRADELTPWVAGGAFLNPGDYGMVLGGQYAGFHVKVLAVEHYVAEEAGPKYLLYMPTYKIRCRAPVDRIMPIGKGGG